MHLYVFESVNSATGTRSTTRTTINLSSNPLTQLNQGVFEPVIKLFITQKPALGYSPTLIIDKSKI